MKSRSPLFCALLVGIASLAATFSGSEVLIYDQKLVRAAQLWRLVTAHLVHAGWLHLAVSLGLFCLVSLAAHHQKERYFCAAIGFTALAVGAGFTWLFPESAGFSGLSAVAWGGAAYVSTAEVSREGPSTRIALVFLTLILLKPVAELFTGGIFLTGAPDAPEFQALAAAHMLGAVAGAVAGYWAGRRDAAPIG